MPAIAFTANTRYGSGMKRHLHLVLGLGVLVAQFVFGAEIPAKSARVRAKDGREEFR